LSTSKPACGTSDELPTPLDTADERGHHVSTQLIDSEDVTSRSVQRAHAGPVRIAGV
jgi:hypothetical protein